MRASPILCLQTGHIGRSIMDAKLPVIPASTERQLLHSLRRASAHQVTLEPKSRRRAIGGSRVGYRTDEIARSDNIARVCLLRCKFVAGRKMNFSQSRDERLLTFYENVRRQVDLDNRAGGRYRFAGEGVKQYAERLREEMDRRRLRYNRIDWP